MHTPSEHPTALMTAALDDEPAIRTMLADVLNEAGFDTLSFGRADAFEAPKRLISRAQMQESLGGAASESFDRAMDVRISRLRTKLREDPKNPQLIKTIYGAGYIFLGDVSWT
jgi:DNA-binding response OmpR family regulator